jgi:fluoroacetyl-CoA thioesterase
MTDELKIGQFATLEREVTADVTADHFGNSGVYVFATPALIALLEETAIVCVKDFLAPGHGTVGTRVDVQHLAATPVGMKIRSRATLVEIDGRRLVFEVEADDEREPIARGRHERFIVNSMEKFLNRAAEKAQTPHD